MANPRKSMDGKWHPGNVELLEALQRKIIEAKKLKSEVKICFINIVAAGLLELSPFVLRLVQRFGQG